MKAWPACEIWLRFLVTTAMARSGILCVVWSSKTLPALRLSSANRRTVMPTPNPRSAKGTISTVVASSHSGSSTTPCDWKNASRYARVLVPFSGHTIGSLATSSSESTEPSRWRNVLPAINVSWTLQTGIMSDPRFLPLAKTRRPDRSGGPAARQSFQASMP